ncbi:hypothetical protein FHT40_004999 [Mycolicibacterium sp. BK556]|uniref:hypothetical protein n=1 Tax=Mycobacteriaceae TaxID=1762 RepID=UPI00178F0386|nr:MULTISPECIES: hypothetical protein [Mycobacteriaceae]MBB3605315.1 hypothetical protein [Mycolicibacterium sp. BK556]MBB3635511.1 hypothetical protein [Mycolicibacterium sp. BK607]MBB3747695.1 hypothetical protein [Mycolicibacterium sp. BK634]
MLAGALIAAAVCTSPAATADPVYPIAGAENARATIDDLEAQGYDVQINWVFGLAKVSLERCRVTAIHNPNSAPPTPGTFDTVYVDVSCPSDDHDWGGIFGIGI